MPAEGAREVGRRDHGAMPGLDVSWYGRRATCRLFALILIRYMIPEAGRVAGATAAPPPPPTAAAVTSLPEARAPAADAHIRQKRGAEQLEEPPAKRRDNGDWLPHANDGSMLLPGSAQVGDEPARPQTKGTFNNNAAGISFDERMHPRNRYYGRRPNFASLAAQFADFAAFTSTVRVPFLAGPA